MSGCSHDDVVFHHSEGAELAAGIFGYYICTQCGTKFGVTRAPHMEMDFNSDGARHLFASWWDLHGWQAFSKWLEEGHWNLNSYWTEEQRKLQVEITSNEGAPA